MNQLKLQEFKEEFEEWCGFSISSDCNDLEELKYEIKNKKWTLECEISEQADRLIDKLVKCFDDEPISKIKRYNKFKK